MKDFLIGTGFLGLGAAFLFIPWALGIYLHYKDKRGVESA